MNKILKTATITEALEALANASFVYNNPCSACGKQCSTPTKDIWMRRIREFQSIERMYAQYKCRNCRKAEHLDAKDRLKSKAIAMRNEMHQRGVEPLSDAAIDSTLREFAKTPEPMITKKPVPLMMQAKKVELAPAPAPAPVKRQPMPGDVVKAPEKSIGTSIWETDATGAMQYRGTQWYKILN